MTLSDKKKQKVLGFLGYGNPAGGTWFVGLEEGLGGQTDEDSKNNLTARGGFSEIMDLYDAHLSLMADGKPIDLLHLRSFTAVWLWMARLIRARQGEEDWEDIGAAKVYIREKLGRSSGSVFLTELSPIPRSTLADKRWSSKVFSSGEADVPEALARRIVKLRELLAAHNPSLVILYSNSSKARSEFQSLFKTSAMAQVLPKVTISADRRFLMVPFFGNGGISFSVARQVVANGLLKGAT